MRETVEQDTILNTPTDQIRILVTKSSRYLNRKFNFSADEQEDIVQIVLKQLIEHEKNHFDRKIEIINLPAFISRVTANVCLDYQKKKLPSDSIALDEDADNERTDQSLVTRPDIQQTLEAQNLLNLFLKEKDLTDQDKRLLGLLIFQYSNAELGMLFNTTEATIRQRKSRLKKKFEQFLQKQAA